MWHGVAPVSSGYDPVLYESPEKKDLLILNAGPGIVSARAWSTIEKISDSPSFKLELRPGDQRVLSGCLVRVNFATSGSAPFAAIAWQVLPK